MAPKKQSPPKPLSPNEKQVLEFLEQFMAAQGFAPTFIEIKDHFGFASNNSVQRYLKQLMEKGYIHIPGGNQKRAITLLHPANTIQDSLSLMSGLKGAPFVSTQQQPTRHSPQAGVASWSLPLLGSVAAGAPIEAYEHNEMIEVPTGYVRNPSKTYALKVQGQSMIEDGILDGDLLFVQRQENAVNGETVIAVIENEATVKRFYLYRDKDIHKFPQGFAHSTPIVELRPANASMQSMWFEPEKVQIQGIVVGLLRRM